MRYGFLIEPDVELAGRLGAEVLETANVHDLVTDPSFMTPRRGLSVPHRETPTGQSGDATTSRSSA